MRKKIQTAILVILVLTTPVIVGAEIETSTFAYSQNIETNYNPGGVYISPDGTMLYFVSFTGGTIDEYELSIPYDARTKTLTNQFNPPQADTISDLDFTPDGTKIVIADEGDNSLKTYSLGGSWNLSTASYTGNELDVSGNVTNLEGLDYSFGGNKVYVTGFNTDSVTSYTLSTPYDVSTGSYEGSFSVATEDGAPSAVRFNENGSRMWMVGLVSSSIYEYDLSTPFDIESATYTGNNLDVSAHVEGTHGIDVSNQGDELYVVGANEDVIVQYNTDLSGFQLEPSAGGGGQITQLELEIKQWQALDSRQDYKVYLNETNTTTGRSTFTEVTTNANVTSGNTSIITVENSTDTLKSHNITGVASISATYDGENSEIVNVTTGNRNLSNIGIMPPSQYINSFLGIDETAGEYGIGSGTQWLIFVIIVAATFGKAFDNDWAGLGLGLLTAIMLWVVEFIGLGMVLTITFFVIFVGTLKMRVHNRGSNGGETNVYVESRDFNK